MTFNNPAPLGRRGFFRAFVGEMASFLDDLKGRPQFRLDDLSTARLSELEMLMPAIRAGIEIRIGEETLDALKAGKAITLFTRDPLTEAVFNRFNGRKSLGDIAEEIHAAMPGVERETALEHARTLFLSLVEQGVCAPSNYGIRRDST